MTHFAESDFPVRPLAELERHLAAWHGGNFVALDAGPGLRLHEGQGLRHVFHNCDGHMFRIGSRCVKWRNGLAKARKFYKFSCRSIRILAKCGK